MECFVLLRKQRSQCGQTPIGIAFSHSSFLPRAAARSPEPGAAPARGVTLAQPLPFRRRCWAARPPPSRGAPRRRAGGLRHGGGAGAAGPGCGPRQRSAAAAQVRRDGAGDEGPGLRSALIVGVARRGCGVGRAAEASCWRAMSSAERPKRPLSAYFRFLRDNQPAFRQQNPDLNSLELVKKLAGVWRELPASQKQVYEEARKTDWRKYEEQLAAYKAQLTPAQAAALKEERRKRLAKRRSFRIKRELTVLGKPKRPRSGFNIFVSENFQQSKGLSPTAKLKQLFETWQNLSSSQKQPYLQLAQDDKVRYQNEMKSWEAKMIELGREDLIRSREQRPKKKTDTAQESSKASLRESLAKLKLKKSEE
ncbi:transcription factor A, mitochondrial isoform X1 [Phasianus colchicus]|uniref:Transcription factor A, mitochondrial n=1 Tax=Phasianus colchicus TaxID=9054 RepID=A0A669QNM8_PHACC|nr:transcription factor A, mitochondrial isoform X1 [Phasianus colchicus]